MNPLPYVPKLGLFLDRLLKQHFFRPAAPQSLSLFRFLYCTALLVTLATDHAERLSRFASDPWHPIGLFELFGVGLMSPADYHILFLVLLVALGLTALGAATRLAAAVACLAFFFYLGTFLGFVKSPHASYVIHTHNIVVFILFILAVAPGVADYGVDGWLLPRLRRLLGWRGLASAAGTAPAGTPATAWPSQLIKLTLGLAYFGAGYCKVAGNPLWADGTTLQSYLMAKHMVIDSPAAAWLAQWWWLCLMLGIATLALELTFFLIVFYPRLTWFYALGAALFHACIWVTMGINFFVYFGFTLLIFVDWPTLQSLAARLSAFAPRRHALSGSEWRPSATTVVGDTLLARGLILGLWAVLATCVYARIESWPFTDYAVFAGRSRLSEVRAFRLAVSGADGHLEWVSSDWPPSRVPFNRWMQTHVSQGDGAALSRMLDDLARQIARHDKTRQFQSLVVVERTLNIDPASGRLLVIDRPLRQATLVGGASRPAVEISQRPLHARVK